jgi:polysaccharide export outer membrane protein
VISVRINAFVVVAFMVINGVCFAQAQVTGQSNAMGAAATPQPLDLRIGAPQQETGRPGLSPLVTINKDYRVGPNDLIDVEIMDLDNMKRTVRVNAAGMISLPLIGAVSVTGLTSQELESRIADRYREKYLQNPQVSVFIKEFTTERITVEGAVAKPGIFPLTGQITLLRALALAGGFGPIANSSEVMLFRVNENRVREVAVFDVNKIRSGANDDPVIKGDDLIVVQRDSTRTLLKDSVFRDILDSINPFSVLSR